MIPAPSEVGPVHFVGVGGVGMSGIAEVLRNLGYEVRGSDQRESERIGELRRIGIPVAIGHDAVHLGNARALVFSSAIPPGNPEIRAAREAGIPVVSRAEMLAELMRFKRNIAVAGTHGKTTTTSLVAAVLDAAHMSPTVINGGVIRSYGSNARLGDGAWMVVEADESDGSFVRLPSTVAVVTNIDPEHLDHYADFAAIRSAFADFVGNVPFYGSVVCCMDHPETRALADHAPGRRVIGYGLVEEADVRAENIRAEDGGVTFDTRIRDRNGKFRTISGLHLPMPGVHNVLNATAAIAVGLEIGISDAVLHDALAEFGGVGRRFTRIGSARGIEVVDDYAHHPVEISATIRAAHDVAQGKILAVHQPHRYTRLASLFDSFVSCFDEADAVVISDVYSAGEDPIDGFDRDRLVEGIRKHGHPRVFPLEAVEQLPALVLNEAGPGDLVLCLGAGSVTQWAHGLPAALETAGRDS